MSAPERPFDAPWQAEVFALTVALSDAGHFTWAEWTAAFGPRVQAAPAGSYYHRWLDTLEALLAERRVASQDDLAALAQAWRRAAAATPHGQPIALSNDPDL